MYFINEKAKAKQNALDYFPGQLNPLCPLAWTERLPCEGTIQKIFSKENVTGF